MWVCVCEISTMMMDLSFDFINNLAEKQGGEVSRKAGTIVESRGGLKEAQTPYRHLVAQKRVEKRGKHTKCPLGAQQPRKIGFKPRAQLCPAVTIGPLPYVPPASHLASPRCLQPMSQPQCLIDCALSWSKRVIWTASCEFSVCRARVELPVVS